MCPRCGELFMLIVPSAFRLLEFYHLLLFYHTRLVHMGAHAPTRTHMKIRIHTHIPTHMHSRLIVLNLNVLVIYVNAYMCKTCMCVPACMYKYFHVQLNFCMLSLQLNQQQKQQQLQGRRRQQQQQQQKQIRQVLSPLISKTVTEVNYSHSPPSTCCEMTLRQNHFPT